MSEALLSALQWCERNKEWFFQGLGAMLFFAVIAFLFGRFRRGGKGLSGQTGAVASRENSVIGLSPTIVQQDGDGSSAVTVGAIHHHHGMTAKDVIESALAVWQANFPRLRDEAMNEANKRVDEFLSDVGGRFATELTPLELAHFREPGVQYCFNQAMQSAALRPETSLRKTLADLLVEHLRQPQGTVMGIVTSEAVKTVPLLTESMLNLLALYTFMELGRFPAVNSWSELADAYRNLVAPFTRTMRPTERQHLVYLGCGESESFSFPEHTTFASRLRPKSASLSERIVTVEEIDKIGLTAEQRSNLFDAKDALRWSFRSTSLAELHDYAEASQIPGNQRSRLDDLFRKSLGDIAEFSEIFFTHVPEARETSSTWNRHFGMFHLTSVGKAIGSAHFENVTGTKIVVRF